MKNTSEYLRKTHNSKIAGFALSLFGATVCWGEVVPLTANWEIYDPQGKSSVSNTSPSGFDANIFDLIDGDPSDERISVYQEFDPSISPKLGPAFGPASTLKS